MKLMIVYKNTFENTRTRNCNFPIEDQYYANDTIAVVADGITRDPVGVFDLISLSLDEMLEKYPRPSGAEMAAKVITKTFEDNKDKIFLLKEMLVLANNNVKILNDKYIPKCDYLK
jgi:hypothetical protein